MTLTLGVTVWVAEVWSWMLGRFLCGFNEEQFYVPYQIQETPLRTSESTCSDLADQMLSYGELILLSVRAEALFSTF